jgi:hypothetical protein
MTDNIVNLVPNTSQEIPVSDYCITDTNGEEFYASGFLLFTSHHVAVMRDTGAGALPVFVMPLGLVHVAEIMEDDEQTEDEVV